MKEIFEIILIALNVTLALYTIYQVGLYVVSLFKRERKPLSLADKTNKIICLVAARNEENVITGLINSLQKQSYPKDSYEIIVIPNNCTDDTEGVSKSAGADVYIPRNKVKSKGDALHETIEYLIKNKEFDAICIFDADNLVHTNYLSEINKSLNNGDKVVAGYRDSKNPYETATSGSCAISFWLLNRVYNEAREKLGLSAVVTGTGFAVSKETLVELGGWNTKTLTEDNEFNVQCACSGIRISYNKNAIFYDEQPLTFKESFKQRRRWTTGDWQVINLYYKRLIEQSFRNKNMLAFDMLMQVNKAFIQVLAIMTMLLNVMFICMNGDVAIATEVITPSAQIMLSVFGWLGNTITTSTFIALFISVLTKANLRNIFLGVLSFWIFVTSYLYLTNLSLVKQETTWKAISHNSKVKLQPTKS